MGRLDGRVVAISGGARGQGRAHAVACAREGAAVALFDVPEPVPGLFYELASEDDLAETRRLVEAAGGEVLAVKADARDPAALAAFAEATLARFGRLDAALVNHGIMVLGDWDVSEEEWDRALDVNLKGAWLTCRALIPALVAQGSGAIVLTASVAGLRGYPHSVPYVVSKHGVIGLMRCLANDLAPHGIRVNAVCPSTVASPMFMNQATWSMFAGGKPDATAADAEFPARNMHLLPVPWVQAEDISAAVVWLVSDEARYVTGVALEVDAGAAAQPNGIPPEAMARVRLPEPGGRP